MNPNEPLSEQIYKIGLEFADAQAGAQLLEEGKAAWISQHMLALGDMPVTSAERMVRGSPEYQEYLTNMVEARRKANRLYAHKEYLRARLMEWSSEQANERLVAKI